MKSILLKDGTRRFLKPTEIMGIINVTEDSFFAGSRVGSTEDALQRAEQMIKDGAAFLDIGGESTRPGALPVTAEEEAAKICPVIRAIKERYPEILVSADTYHASTAEKAIEAGVDIINDISGLTADPEMIPVCAKAGVPVIIMHSKGDPEHMQDNPQYDDVVEEVYAFLKTQVAAAIAGGIRQDRIMIDVGIGFGKNLEHNMALLRNIGRFNELYLPHLMAVSRKTWIGMLLGKDGKPVPSEERLYGTIASSIYAYTKNIEMVRVHDVKENAEALLVFEELQKFSGKESGKFKAVIAMGSNLGDKRGYLEKA
ncbi:MAG: dihydropteroate synthase, partial [Parasporobacterium sp.]|nr:dihydropteroate synthase [Parasporobacterium sp.]